VQLLHAVGLVAPAELDAATADGHLYAACCRAGQLARAPPAKAAAAAAAGVDMQAACVEEAVLVTAHALALRQRLRQLLQDWPEHPGLLQASVDCWPCGDGPVLAFIAGCSPEQIGLGCLKLAACAPSWYSTHLGPFILQLSAVIDRLLGLPVTAPLKAMLTGVELLLAKAQVGGRRRGLPAA
jgi:hypothetical protein